MTSGLCVSVFMAHIDRLKAPGVGSTIYTLSFYVCCCYHLELNSPHSLFPIAFMFIYRFSSHLLSYFQYVYIFK